MFGLSSAAQPPCRGAAALAAILALIAAQASGAPLTSALYATNGGLPEMTQAAYRALSARQSRSYDKRQDISPRQLLILLEVAARTDSSLGQALATGEMESAHTWNDHIRPPHRQRPTGLGDGGLAIPARHLQHHHQTIRRTVAVGNRRRPGKGPRPPGPQ